MMVLYPPYAAIGKKMNIPIYEHMFACLEWRYPCGCALYSTFFPDGTVPAFSLKHTENRKIECPLVSSKGKHPQKERKQNAKQHTILRHRMQMAALNSRTGVFGSLHDGIALRTRKKPAETILRASVCIGRILQAFTSRTDARAGRQAMREHRNRAAPTRRYGTPQPR